MAGEQEHKHVAILFTAFEPSGDALAAPVIRELLRRWPGTTVYAWGGPKMAEAGAIIVQKTCEDAAMGLKAFGKVLEMHREVGRVRRWAKQFRVMAHVAVDAPAANFPICKVMHQAGARIIHLVAPQLWAWARWRIGKLRRLTNLVLCLLPFEEPWFVSRGVPAKFIGHPAINRTIDRDSLRDKMHGLPSGAPRLALFPGSRSHEVKANIRLLVNAYTELQSRHAGMAGVVVAANPALNRIIRKKIKVFPKGLHMITGMAEAAIGWCDLALAVSGTISLDIAVQRKPMIGVYKTSWLTWLLSFAVIRAPLRLLPNIVAEREIVPEFVPHAGGPMAIVHQATRYLQDSKIAAVQSEELNRVCLRFSNHDPAAEAAAWIMRVVEHGTVK